MNSTAMLIVWGGFFLALLFGWIASRSNFCTMGALSDVVNMSHWGRMRMWLLAIAVAIVGTSGLAHSGLINTADSIYQRPVLNWLSAIVGGVVFGIGMTLAGGCANKNLIRVGAGSIRSFVVLIFVGLSGYMTLKGVLAPIRVWVLDPVSIDFGAWGMHTQGLPNAFAQLTGMGAESALEVCTALVSMSLLVFVFKDKRFRQNHTQVLGAVGLGLLIVAGWYLTGHLGYGENPDTLEMGYFATNTHTIESFSFVAPLGYGLELLLLWTDASLHMSFGIASTLGVVCGSLLWALYNRSFHLEGFVSVQDLMTQIAGALLMGFGGVTAVGCTVGQGMSGISTLSMGSVLALAGIISGSVATLHWQSR
jgi:uncharacterized membrane protein YedE/YeeE